MNPLKLIITSDGSHSLFREDLNETYHSHHGAVQESQYVFIKQGLAAWSAAHPGATVKILELGLGTALNALLTRDYAEQHALSMEYTGVEAYPVPEEIYGALNYHQHLPENAQAQAWLQQLHAHLWDSPLVALSPHFQFQKLAAKIEDAKLPAGHFDLVYFDAFAPNKQAELWEPAVLEQMATLLAPGGYLTTYCAKGQFKRDLKAAGFEVQTLPGAPGKAEMVRGVRV